MNKKANRFTLSVACWAIGLGVAGLAIVAWGQSLRWRFDGPLAYLLFPLCGLLAFSLMWSHYVAGVLRRVGKAEKAAIQTYLSLTGYAVLLLICLHPGLLIWQLWRDGFGLPPDSYLQNYVAPSLRWVAMLGTVSLIIFLAYELKRWFKDKLWWKYIVYAGDLAMVAIFYHALRLGTQTQAGWYKWVWLFYGITLVGSLGFIYYVDRHDTQVKGRKQT